MTDHQPRVLIVDDERSNIKILGNLLADDFAVIVATNGAAALQRATAETPPDIILLDVMMPDLNGYEVCRRLKSDPLTRHIPVIFITSMGEEDSEALGLEVGAVDYITKPFAPAVVKMRIRTHMELKRLRDHWQKLSMIDPLTELSNRRRFDEVYASAWQYALRHRTPLSLLMIDVDRFKAYNDYYGHGGGDDCLRKVAYALKRVITRTTDLLARYGGEEFVCLMPGTDLDGGEIVAARLRQAILDLELPHDHPDVQGQVTISVGLAAGYPSPEYSPDSFVVQADRWLYEAKSKGRNRVCLGGVETSSS